MSQFVFALYHFFLGLIFLHHWIIVSQQNYIVNRWFSRKVHQWATIPRYLTTIAVYAVSSSSSSSLSPPVGWRGRALSWSLLQARVQDGGAPPVGSGPLHMRRIFMIAIKSQIIIWKWSPTHEEHYHDYHQVSHNQITELDYVTHPENCDTPCH